MWLKMVVGLEKMEYIDERERERAGREFINEVNQDGR